MTGRQRESIPAGTGTTDLPRERRGEKEREMERDGDREKERVRVGRGQEGREERRIPGTKGEKERSDEKRAVSRGGAGVTIR